MLVFVFVTFFFPYVYVNTHFEAFIYELIIEHTPIATILIEHTLIGRIYSFHIAYGNSLLA